MVRDTCECIIMKIYIAAPLFNDMERSRNDAIDRVVQECGCTTYLPQRDGGVSYNLIRTGMEKQKVRSQIFDTDVRAIYDCDAVLALLDGRVPDEGMCIEIGMAYALRKPILGYRTDNRAFDENGDLNIILSGCLTKLCDSIEDLRRDILLLLR